MSNKDKSSTFTRIYKSDKEKLNDLSFELSAIQKKFISKPELIRRTLRIPNLKDVLIKDAIFKKGAKE